MADEETPLFTADFDINFHLHVVFSSFKEFERCKTDYGQQKGQERCILRVFAPTNCGILRVFAPRKDVFLRVFEPRNYGFLRVFEPRNDVFLRVFVPTNCGILRVFAPRNHGV
ncbi:hypothetical protein CAPTEDRAFT_187695 [Capitella teleta]|uniref:Uncharacterized protein n=1 Tax=Capitella teleta TaxID=283909 RepID=R7UGC4_CAPTE|nr:hypothetical protein CAPTEDRAFT_187695 [Capitella teleta]|eukprot:ELU05564.1 hypothetical protein CAPTEDRAFT_187695 [Capitella teleta]